MPVITLWAWMSPAAAILPEEGTWSMRSPHTCDVTDMPGTASHWPEETGQLFESREHGGQLDDDSLKFPERLCHRGCLIDDSGGPLELRGDPLGDRFLSLCLCDDPVYRSLSILSLIRVRDLSRLHRLGQLSPQGRQFLPELLAIGCRATLADILQARHHVLGNDILHCFDTAAVLQIARQR